LRRGFSALVLLALISTTLYISTESVSAFSSSSGEAPSQPAGYALHVLTPAEVDFAYIRREIEHVAVEDGGEYFVELWVKVTRFSPLPAGVVFLFDMVDEAGSVRYSVRLTNDRGVLFYYPHGQSSAVFTAKDVWSPGWWYSYTIRHRGSEAWFYVNQSLVGSSESTGLEALGGEFTIVRISRLGEPDSGRIVFEGFADSVRFLVSGAPIFLEDFETGLEGYDVVKSPSAVLETVSPVTYSTLTLIVRPTLAATGGSVTLVGWLRDSSNFGVANRTIHFEYNLGNGVWTVLGTVTSGVDGSFTYEWKLPTEFKGRIALKARFLGDAEYEASESASVQISIRPPTRLTLDYRYLALALLAILIISAVLVFKKRVETREIVASGFLLTGSLHSFFAFIAIVNSLKLEYYLAYQRRIVELTIFSPTEDLAILFIASIALVSLPIALGFVYRIRLSRSFLLMSIAFPISGILQFLGPRVIATALLVVAGFAIILLGIMSAQMMLSMSKCKAASIYASGFLLILLLIELGSTLAWIWNIFDPHYPFDASSRWILPEMEMQIANVAYPLAPWLLSIFLFSWLLLPILEMIARRLNLKTFWQNMYGNVQRDHPSGRMLPHWLYSFLGIFLLLLFAGFLVYYPYFYESRLLGVDTKYYFERLVKMEDWESCKNVLFYDHFAAIRMPYFMWLYLLKLLTGFQAMRVVQIAPILPICLLALSTYFFVKVGTRDEFVSLLSSVLTVFSMHMSVGMFAGIFANWLALPGVLILLTFLLKASEGSSGRYVVGACFMSFCVLLTHGWTWGIAMAVLVVSVALAILCRKSKLSGLKCPSWFVVTSVVITVNMALVSSIVFGTLFSPVVSGARSAVFSGYFDVAQSMSLINFWRLTSNVWHTLRWYVGGFMAMPLAFILGLFGVMSVRDMKEDFNRMVLSFLLPISVGFVLVDSWYQWRFMYILPLEVYMALGVSFLTRRFYKIATQYGGEGKKWRKLFLILFVAVIVLSFMNYAFRSLSFLIPS